MKRQFKSGLQLITLLTAATVLGTAQTTTGNRGSNMPPPGAVNYIEGQVSIDGQEISQQNLRSVVLAPNQALDTGNGYAEVLLTPGAFLRLGHDSEVRLGSAGLADVQFTLTRGSALVEVADLVKGSRLSAALGNATAQVEDKGLYALSVSGNSFQVLDGKLKVIDNDQATTLHKGDEVVLTSDRPLKKRDFDKKAVQSQQLFVWSRVRSQQEEAANVNMANSLLASGGWNGPGWYWDPYWSFYSFVPGYGFLGGPFGYGFYSPFALRAGYLGYYGRGFYGRPVAGYYRGFRGGMPAVHGTAGVRSMGGGFHGGGGRR